MKKLYNFFYMLLAKAKYKAKHSAIFNLFFAFDLKYLLIPKVRREFVFGLRRYISEDLWR
ncbi:MAG: hypothetical protein AB1349_13850 [Elusimicrobiota bacterium]